MPRCSEELPPHFALDDAPGHWAACWLYADNAVVDPAVPEGATRLDVVAVTSNGAAVVDAAAAEQSAGTTEVAEVVEIVETAGSAATGPETGAEDEEASQ
jgi:peptide/nickel transport system ATP-binding protein